MKIISVRNGFTADHSSTSYEFLAVNKPLAKKEREAVAALSSRANPTARRVSFSYHVDGYDIPRGWEQLMEKYYDVMYREDYDWWTIAIAFQTFAEQVSELRGYAFDGEDDMGVEVIERGERVIVVIHCRLDNAHRDDFDTDYDDEAEDEESENPDQFVAEDELLNLLVQLREQLKQGDYRVLYAVWEKYGVAEAPPVPLEKQQGKKLVEQFFNMLESV